MRRYLSRTITRTALIMACVLALNLATSASKGDDGVKPPPAGFKALFNGKDLEGWHGRPHLHPQSWSETNAEQRAEWNKDMNAHWTIKDGVLINDGFGVFLSTDTEYGDIELFIDYKTVAKADSGIYLRGTPQVQIWDSTEEAKFNLGANKGSGALWNNSPGSPGKDPLVLADKPFGEWNTLRIVQVGARTSVWLNGKHVVDNAIMENFWGDLEEQKRKASVQDKIKVKADDANLAVPLFAKGVIQLQTHGGEIQWRNLFVRELEAEEANKWLRDHSQGTFTSLFNGKDLSNWKGETDNYEVVEGAIRCKSGHGGVLHTEKEYGDFTARLEFLVPEGGNNGLAIRYPGKGDTAYVGMCELQVLDNTSPKYAKLDPRQYHGSAYGIIAAKLGYQRPVGQWNYQEVTVKGSTIRVELNGTVILDGDVSKVTEYMANSPHPGKDRKSGFFGFAGHNDPVRFRAVDIMAH